MFSYFYVKDKSNACLWLPQFGTRVGYFGLMDIFREIWHINHDTHYGGWASILSIYMFIKVLYIGMNYIGICLNLLCTKNEIDVS